MIPKKIHYCWLSGDEIPEMLQKCMATWKEKMPDYEFILWDKSKFDVNSVRWVKEAYDAKKYAFAADYIRFYALYNYGGIYLDTDVEVLKTFDPLLSNKSFMGFEYISTPEAAVIGTEAGVNWIKKCLEYYNGKSFYDENGNIRNLAVPIMMKANLQKLYKQEIRDTSSIQHFDDLDLYPYQYFSPRDPYKNRINVNSDTYCIHHSVGSWCNGGRKTINRYKNLLLVYILGKRKYDEILFRHLYKRIKKEVEN
ncbi:MAG: glycosyl transferase [Chitinivibrionia bacterium]|nr:glycosyl transferase [Chitinivibrionia bacterium]